MGIRHGRGDLGSAHLPVQVRGPRAKDVVGSLFGDEVLEMPYYHCAHALLDGIPVVLGRTGWTGEVGYEIYLLDPERGDDLWDRVMEAGAPHDVWPIAPCEPRRIEAGIFNYRSDMTLDDNPFEVTGLERLVEEHEADYIGKAALERIRAEGVTREAGRHGGRRRRARLGADPVLAREAERGPGRARDGRDPLSRPEEEHRLRVGADRARRAGQGPRLELPDGSRRAARTAALPFIDPRKERPAARP